MARESCNLDKDEAEILKPSSSPSPSPSPSPSSPPSLFLKPCEELPIGRSERPESPNSDNVVVVGCAPKHDKESEKPAKFGNRCSSCRKKVGLTGFRCRCGDLFCGHHRYSDTHDCSFDYKAAGREEIARANPVIRAAKIIKI